MTPARPTPGAAGTSDEVHAEWVRERERKGLTTELPPGPTVRLTHQIPAKQQAGAAGPGLLSDTASGVTDVDAFSVSVGNVPVNPTPTR